MRVLICIIAFSAIIIGGIWFLDKDAHLKHRILSKEDNARLSKLPRP